MFGVGLGTVSKEVFRALRRIRREVSFGGFLGVSGIFWVLK